MNIALDPETRHELQARAGRIGDLVERSSDETPTTKEEPDERRKRRGRWLQGLEDSILDLVNLLPAGVEDYEARQLLKHMTELRRAVEADVSMTDGKGDIRLSALRMRDVLRRMIRQLEHSVLEDPDAAAKFIFTKLSEQPLKDIAPLLGVSTKTAGRWRNGEPVGHNESRVVLVAQLASYLQHTLTQRGLLLWLAGPAERLDDQSPVHLLNDGLDEHHEQLISFARGGRGQLAN